jgi:hypothetical protein
VFIIEIDLASLRFFLSYSKYLTAARRHGTFNHNKNYLATVSEKKLSKKRKRTKKIGWLMRMPRMLLGWLDPVSRRPEPGSRTFFASLQHSARAEADACVQLVCCKKV